MVTVESGEAGVKRHKQEPFDLLLLDKLLDPVTTGQVVLTDLVGGGLTRWADLDFTASSTDILVADRFFA